MQDRLAPVANGRALKEEAGQRVQLVEVENAGHAVLLEKPALVLDQVSAFLKAHRITKSQ
jgi:pimeloyl-ACP methyl ester carboxylesterase